MMFDDACLGNVYKYFDGLKPVVIMVVAQLAMAGLNVFYKLAANDGMSLTVMVAYRFLFAAAFMVPLAIAVERGKRPKLTRVIVGQAFLCALLGGSFAQNLYVEALVLTSATFASAITNLIPIFTFIMALFFRMEILDLKTWPGKAKVVGILVGLGGAMLMTLYKGQEIVIWSMKRDLVQEHHQQSSVSNKSNRSPALGSFLAIIGSLSYSFSLIIQAKMCEKFPFPYSTTALIAVMGSIQSFVSARVMEGDWSQWKLGLNIRLLSVAYAGIVASGLTVIFVLCCLSMRGPLFVSVFGPLMLVFTAIAGSLILEEKLHLGSVIGCVLIICGLYMVLWGKSKDLHKISSLPPSKANEASHKVEILISSSSENEIIKGCEDTGIVPKSSVVMDTAASQVNCRH